MNGEREAGLPGVTAPLPVVRVGGWGLGGAVTNAVTARWRPSSNPAPRRNVPHRVSLLYSSNSWATATNSYIQHRCTDLCIFISPVNGSWTAWGEWSPCDCHTKTRHSRRECSNPPPANGGQTCTGLSVNVSDCLPTDVDQCPGNVNPCTIYINSFKYDYLK